MPVDSRTLPGHRSGTHPTVPASGRVTVSGRLFPERECRWHSPGEMFHFTERPGIKPLPDRRYGPRCSRRILPYPLLLQTDISVKVLPPYALSERTSVSADGDLIKAPVVVLAPEGLIVDGAVNDQGWTLLTFF